MSNPSRKKIVLEALPGSQREIKEKTGLGLITISRHIAQMRIDRECHISAWMRPSKGAVCPVYSAGDGFDVPCYLRNFTESENSARYRKNRDAKLKQPG